MTNGEKIKSLFPDIEEEKLDDIIDVYGMSKCRVTFDTDWWNEEYKEIEDESQKMPMV